MVVLVAIGRFFKKIWDWIKQTAWIQPLLIVGIIFGVIFSIPSIVEASKKSRAERSKYNSYYHNCDYQLSLVKDSNGVSEADDFTNKLFDAMGGDVTAFENSYSKLEKKFFVAIVAEECTECESAKEGFATFEKKLNNDSSSTFKTDGEEKFHMVTMFQDEEKYSDSEPEDTPFYDYCLEHQDFFEDVGVAAGDTAYKTNGHLAEDKLEALATADCEEFSTPTIMLVEYSANEAAYLVTEVMFGVSGSDKNEKAQTLFDCWTHDGEFSLESLK